MADIKSAREIALEKVEIEKGRATVDTATCGASAKLSTIVAISCRIRPGARI